MTTLTIEQIVEMAREVWLSDYGSKVMLGGEDVEINLEDLEAFAKLVASAAIAKEREACIKICEDFADVDSGPDGIMQDYHAYLIRARGQHE